MNQAGKGLRGIGFALLLSACGRSSGSDGTDGGSPSDGGAPSNGGTGGVMSGAAGSVADGSTTGGASGSKGGAAATNAQSGNGGSPAAGTGGDGGGTPSAGAGAGAGMPGSNTGGMAGSAGLLGSAGVPVNLPPLVTSAPDAYWQTNGTLTESTRDAIVTVHDTDTLQTWEGFGAAFNELGWSYLTSTEMVNEAARLLFSATDGAAFAWARVPIGASDYAVSRYTLDDTGTDLLPTTDEINRPPTDVLLTSFSLDRDREVLIPAIRTAQGVKPDLRFWASPWTPPVWMKVGYNKTNNANSTSTPEKPSYFDGGSMKSDAEVLHAYAEYLAEFVRAYQQQGIDIRVVSPQSEPGYEFNYPSCLWDQDTYTRFVGQFLGPAMRELGVDVMLGPMSNGDYGHDLELIQAVLADPTATGFIRMIGAQWGVLDETRLSELGSTLPVWATEHKGGNYPWLSEYMSDAAPNDHAYGVESWYYIRDAINKLKVTSYNAWNMVLDPYGWSIDTSRAWAQDALLVAYDGKVTPTPAYYVFRHLSQYVTPGARVVSVTGGDGIAFKNPDGSLVTVVFNSGAAEEHFVVALGGKRFEFAMPANGWATLKYRP